MLYRIYRTLLAVFCFPVFAQELPRIVVDPSIDQSKVDISGLWAREVLPRIVRLSGQAKLPESLTFIRSEVGFFAGGTYENPILSVQIHNNFPYQTGNIDDNVYRGITHEVGHALSPYGITGRAELGEGLAEAMKRFVYAQLERENPDIRTGSYVFVQDMLNNLDVHAAAENSNVYDHRGKPYQASGGMLELLLRTEEDFRAIGRAIETRNLPTVMTGEMVVGHTTIADYAELLQIIQTALGNRKIAGVSVSTFLDRILASRQNNGPDGKHGFVLPLNASEQWASGTYPPVNPRLLMVSYFDRKDGVSTTVDKAAVSWSIRYGSSDEGGREMVPETSSEITAASPSFFLPDISAWPEGGYVVNAKIGDIATANFFIILRDPAWKYGGMLVITNGPNRFDQLTDYPKLTPSPECGKMRVLPGLLYFRDTAGDCTLTDKDGRKATFASHPYYSPIHLFHRRSQPIIEAIVDSAAGQTGPVTPGSWLTLLGWGFTPNDPKAASATPLPATGCDGTVSVMFSDGIREDVPGSIGYCSGRQINVQVPQELPTGDYRVAVKLNRVDSSPVAQELALHSPKIFLASPDLGAIVHQNGQLVDREHPAKPGEMLSLYGMGLGPVDPIAPGTGKPSSAPRYATTQPAVALSASASPNVQFAGLAPWLIGVYQVNFLVPPQAGASTQKLSVSAGGKTSNEVTLWISQ